MTPRTLSIGGATYDLFMQTEQPLPLDSSGTMLQLALGSKIRVHDVIETCGGGASNTSVGLARLGCASSFCGVLGSDAWGQRLLENLVHEGVDISGVTQVEGETSSFSLILSVSSGERVILVDPGTNAHLDTVTFDESRLRQVDWVYLNHLQEESCAIHDALAAIFASLPEEDRPGLTWNPGSAQVRASSGDASLRALMPHVTLITVNKEEALAFTKTSSVADAARCLLSAGIAIVCITDGSRGSVGATQGEMLSCGSDAEASVIDTTGAGDAFGVGATWAAIQGMPLREILACGTLNATSVVGHFGAQAGLLTDTDMRQRLTSMQRSLSPIRIEN